MEDMKSIFISSFFCLCTAFQFPLHCENTNFCFSIFKFGEIVISWVKLIFYIQKKLSSFMEHLGLRILNRFLSVIARQIPNKDWSAVCDDQEQTESRDTPGHQTPPRTPQRPRIREPCSR